MRRSYCLSNSFRRGTLSLASQKYLLIALTLIVATLSACTNNRVNTTAENQRFSSEKWQTVSLGDHKMGYRHITREQETKLLKTTETLTLTLSQPGVPDREIATTLNYHESLAGKPIALFKTVSSDTANHKMSATIKGKTLILKRDNSSTIERYPIPQPFLLAEGLRLTLIKLADTRQEFEYYSWNFSTRQFDKTQLRISPYTSSEHPDYAWRIQKTTGLNSNSKHTDIFTDTQFHVLEERSHSNGEELLITSCDKACATASFVPNTHVYRQLIQSPYKISDTALHGKIRYQLSGDFQLDLPNTYEQRSNRTLDGAEIIVCKDCGTETPPDNSTLRDTLEGNYWLPAQTPIFKNVVADILPNSSSASGQMQRLTRYVARHMSEEPSYSGYATALEAYNSKQGDCTEHALLLATLARAAQIPTRVVFGLAYTNERFLGRKYVFVPHAWVQAWTGERWESYDSGLGEFSAGHIALGLSNGDQADILRINEQLQKIKITSAIQIRSR
ncbi:transglutaminase-like domain-containing protein [Zhongshania aliphaticivorans]|uniref:transglutaminase-like domain-containing protein n=1 Tax=Zhongshania aliphaticivorans TaxID=1470434 RepID=UPI0012E4362E|nr:transglutaminase-like domain-containing protein [Zhongshania aliphaticivorans]CAA0094979.1 Uncharacterised protein [Zhongshania aliphaticivorans]